MPKTLMVAEPFDSWSIYKRAEVHWASIARRGLVHALFQTKYFVRINSEALLHGLYFERSDDRGQNQDDWQKFLAWTSDAENCRWLHRVVRQTGATFTNPYPEQPGQCFYGQLVALDDGRFRHEADASATFDAPALSAFLGDLRSDLWLNLVISKTTSRDDVIAQGARIEATIGHFFNTLLPIYESRAAADT